MAEAVQRPKGLEAPQAALKTRKSSTMLAFGFSSGLPYALLIGTLNAWLGEFEHNLATIGVLSWIGLSYSFKFLWSPLVDRLQTAGSRSGLAGARVGSAVPGDHDRWRSPGLRQPIRRLTSAPSRSLR